MATADTIKTIKDTLAPFIKTREQTAYVRRVLALHLASHLPRDALSKPLVQIDGPLDLESYKTVPPSLQRDYLRALSAKGAAIAQLDDVMQKMAARPGPITNPELAQREQEEAEEKRAAGVDILRKHAASIETRKKKERLEVLQKHINTLGRMPAASPTFLDPKEVFGNCAPVPPLPKEVSESFTLEPGAPRGDLKALTGRLERVALRAKLQFEKEDAILQDVKSRTSGVVEKAGPEAKLCALNVTRDELITWIEAELSKTSDGNEGDSEGEGEPKQGSIRNIKEHEKTKAMVVEQLDGIKKLYAEYVVARKVLISSTTTRPQVPEIITKEPSPSLPFEIDTPTPPLHFLMQQIQTLLALSREHKSIMAHKNHITDLFERQLRETSQTLDTLASESQLLANLSVSRGPATHNKPSVAMGGGRLGSDAERPSLTSQIRPWVAAADDAKLATLETVAEKIEQGEIALKECFEAVEEVNKIIGRDPNKRVEENKVNDQAQSFTEGGRSRVLGKRAAPKSRDRPKSDLWSQLRGDGDDGM